MSKDLARSKKLSVVNSMESKVEYISDGNKTYLNQLIENAKAASLELSSFVKYLHNLHDVKPGEGGIHEDGRIERKKPETATD